MKTCTSVCVTTFTIIIYAFYWTILQSWGYGRKLKLNENDLTVSRMVSFIAPSTVE